MFEDSSLQRHFWSKFIDPIAAWLLYSVFGLVAQITQCQMNLDLRLRLLLLSMFKPSSDLLADRSKAVHLLWILFLIYVSCLSLLCWLVCCLQPCDHLLGKVWPLDCLVCCVFLCFWHFPIWCSRSDVVLGPWYKFAFLSNLLRNLIMWSLNSWSLKY